MFSFCIDIWMPHNMISYYRSPRSGLKKFLCVFQKSQYAIYKYMFQLFIWYPDSWILQLKWKGHGYSLPLIAYCWSWRRNSFQKIEENGVSTLAIFHRYDNHSHFIGIEMMGMVCEWIVMDQSRCEYCVGVGEGARGETGAMSATATNEPR